MREYRTEGGTSANFRGPRPLLNGGKELQARLASATASSEAAATSAPGQGCPLDHLWVGQQSLASMQQVPTVSSRSPGGAACSLATVHIRPPHALACRHNIYCAASQADLSVAPAIDGLGALKHQLQAASAAGAVDLARRPLVRSEARHAGHRHMAHSNQGEARRNAQPGSPCSGARLWRLVPLDGHMRGPAHRVHRVRHP